MRLFNRIILFAANASEMVITAGNASGIAATASEILVRIILTICSPRNQPEKKENA